MNNLYRNQKDDPTKKYENGGFMRGIAKVRIGKTKFQMTITYQEKVGEGKDAQYIEKTTDKDTSPTFDLSVLKEWDFLPKTFVLEEIKYAVVTSADFKKVFNMRPANLENVDMVFDGFLRNKDGDYVINMKDVRDDKGTVLPGKKQITIHPQFRIVSPDKYAGFVYPQCRWGIPFSNYKGNWHFEVSEDGGWSLTSGNYSWKNKRTSFADLYDFIDKTGLYKAEVEVPDANAEPAEWLDMLERANEIMNLKYVGMDLHDGYIAAWGEAEPADVPDAPSTPEVEAEQEDDDEFGDIPE